MAKPDTKTEEQQGSAIARAGGYPVGFLTPGDCSRMTPFSLIRRMTEEMDGVFGEFALSRGEAGKPTWSPEVKLEIADDAIVLEGERWMENQDNKGGLHLTGRQYGRFYRTLPLPEKRRCRGSLGQVRKWRTGNNGAAARGTAQQEPGDPD